MAFHEQTVSSYLQQSDAPHVVAVSLSPLHRFSKQPQTGIRLLAGQGVQGDAHCGSTVQHLYLKRKNPAAPNRMQVHLLQAELLDDLAAEAFAIGPGDLGENILTRGIDLLSLPQGTRLSFDNAQHEGDSAVVALTCLRQPCIQIERFRPGLQRQMSCLPGAPTKYRAGVMAVVLTGGLVSGADHIFAQLPAGPHLALTT